MIIVCANIYEISLLSLQKKSNCKYSWTFFFAVYSIPLVSRLINSSHASAALPGKLGLTSLRSLKLNPLNHSMMATERDTQWKDSEGILLPLSILSVTYTNCISIPYMLKCVIMEVTNKLIWFGNLRLRERGATKSLPVTTLPIHAPLQAPNRKVRRRRLKTPAPTMHGEHSQFVTWLAVAAGLAT